MDKRTFLKNTAILTAGAATASIWSSCTSGNTTETAIKKDRTEAFVLPKLSFPTDALAPNIDKMTMEIHHGKHHAGYVRKLNKAAEGTKFEKLFLEDILQEVKPEEKGIRNNGGGHYNHQLFWAILSPKGGGAATGDLAAALIKDFGSFEKFKTTFETAAKTVFGSGWAWLSLDKNGKLFVSKTANQDNPLMTNIVEKNGTPILGLDVWEHAYYLNYQNKRGDYVNNFFNVIDWEAVGANYELLKKRG